MTITYFQVGGCVRDHLLGVKSKDIDYAVEAPSFDAMAEDIERRGGKIYIKHPEFFTIRAKDHGEDADFVLCRKDGVYRDGRRPDEVTMGTIDDDLARRDFTMNAIAKRMDGTLYDPHGGAMDIENKIIRTVGAAMDRFNEDPLRLLRAFRFAVTKGFNFHSDVTEALRNDALLDKLQKSVSVERVKDELNKALAFDTHATMQTFRYYPELMFACFARPGLSLEATQRVR